MRHRSKPVRKAGPAGRTTRPRVGGGVQIVRTKGERWSPASATRFLDVLAATCNVRLSAAEAGFSFTTVYKRRRDDPAFAEQWQVALEQGYARIEMGLVRAAGDAAEGCAPDPEADAPAMTVDQALAVLRLHRAAVTGVGRSRGWQARPRSLEELRDGILAKLEAIETERLRNEAAGDDDGGDAGAGSGARS